MIVRHYLYTGHKFQNILIDYPKESGKFIYGLLPNKQGKIKFVKIPKNKVDIIYL